QTELHDLLPPRLTPGDFASTTNGRGRVYLEEAFYFVPILAALTLQKGAEYVAALDWFRLVYNYSLPRAQRSLLGLAPHKTNDNDFQRDDPHVQGDEYDWLLDPLNPHSIAQTRRDTYLRFTKISIIKCLLDYADAEYTTDTSESVPVARELYMTALALLYEDDLKPASETCEGVLGDLEITFVGNRADYLPALVGWIGNRKIVFARQLRDALTKVFERYIETGLLLEKARESLTKLQPAAEPQPRLEAGLNIINAQSLRFETAFLTDKYFPDRLEAITTRFSGLGVGAVSGPGGDPYPGTDGAPFPVGPIDGGAILGVHGRSDGFQGIPFEPNPGAGSSLPPSPPDYSGLLRVSTKFCVPQNPILGMLRLRANLNLYKIRTCRNISWLRRVLEPYAGPTDTQTGLPSIGTGAQLVLPGATRIRPTPSRYQTLIERAKQLVQLAMQIEQALLSALEKSDAEAYTMLKAKQDLNLSQAGVRLQELRVTEAQGGVKLATLQRNRAAIQINAYNSWISAGLSDAEKLMLAGFIVS